MEPTTAIPSARVRRSKRSRTTFTGLAIAALSLPLVTAQSTCISLSGSTQCPAFNASSISTDTTLRGFFPFLAFVNDVTTFDTQFAQYIASSYSQQKYQQLLGCSNVNLSNTTSLYARYTATVLCNSIVQNSIAACSATGNAIRPVCADTCAEFARSEQSIASTPAICSVTNNDSALTQIRADFTNCALPANSLTNNCIRGVQNEPNNCGFSSNLGSLCSYCAASSPNATDSCCLFSNTESRCQNVRLPITTAMGNLFPSSTSSSAPAATSTGGAVDPLTRNTVVNGLSGGAIAGIVIGSLLGALLLLALIIFGCIWSRKRKESQAGSIFNQPSPTRQGPMSPPSFTGSNRNMAEVLPVGARVHQMAALENNTAPNGEHSSPVGGVTYNSSSTGHYDDSPESQRSQYTASGGIGVAGITKRHASTLDSSSPKSLDDLSSSSPQDVSSGHSEQLASFKDYYSNDEIHPNDAVSVLWAYQPRAGDEWELERGDMIKVVGIWDDGWATGMRVSSRAEDFDVNERNLNRDSGLSTTGGERQVSAGSGGEPGSEIKAFPLVCVCLPQHWRKTIEGDTLDPGTSSAGDPNSSP